MADSTSPTEGSGDVDPGKVEQAEEVAKRLLEQGETTDAPMPEKYKYLAERAALLEIELKKENARQDLKLRETYAKGLLAILALELVVVNVLFWLYAAKGVHWKIPDNVIQVWFGATVVQVVGIVTVVTRYLFPKRDNQFVPMDTQPPQMGKT